MKEVSLFEAKTHLSGLVNEIVNTQNEIAITKHGYPVILMKPFSKSVKPDIQEAIRTIKQLRNALKSISLEEILEMRDEGRHVYP